MTYDILCIYIYISYIYIIIIFHGSVMVRSWLITWNNHPSDRRSGHVRSHSSHAIKSHGEPPESAIKPAGRQFCRAQGIHTATDIPKMVQNGSCPKVVYFEVSILMRY